MNDTVIFNAGFPLHVKTAKTIREKLGKPVCMAIAWEWTERRMTITADDVREIGAVYSLPCMYKENISRFRAMSITELDKVQNALEHELGIMNNAQLASHDRHLRTVCDYRQARNIQVINLLLAKKIFDENSPSLMLSERISYLGNVLGEACRARHIPEVWIYNTFGSAERLGAFDRKEYPHSILKTFQQLQAGEGKHDPKAIESADTWLADFLAAPSKPPRANSIEGKQAKFKFPRFAGTAQLMKQYRQYRDFEFDRTSGVLPNPLKSLLDVPRNKTRMFLSRVSEYPDKQPDLTQKYFYVPLNYHPEISTLYFGSEYEHVESYIKQLSKKIPSDHMIYVKEHPSMHGLRERSLYHSLDRTYNVKTIHPSVSTFELTKNSTAVITVTGTAGWEAFLMGKPVVVLGDVFYNHFPGVHKAALHDTDFLQNLLMYLQTYRFDKRARDNIVRAIFLETIPSPLAHDENLGVHQQGSEDDSLAYFEAVVEVLRLAYTSAHSFS